MSLDYFLERTEQSIKSIQSLEFSKQGIFTNAIVKRPNITTLLKDPSPDEQSLYRVVRPRLRFADGEENGDVRPGRVDGKSIFSLNTSEEDGKRVVVQVPKIRENIASDPPSSPTKFFPEYDTEDVGELCDIALNLTSKYPTLVGDGDTLEKIYGYQRENNIISDEILTLERRIEEQKRQLNVLNINYSDIGSPTKSDNTKIDTDPSDDDVDIDEYIRREEEEIKELQMELEQQEFAV